MSPGTRPSQNSPRGFFRLEPIQSHSSSGEACLSLNHVADNNPFVPESKRPWVSRRKSRRKDPPWKKFVTVFRVAPIPVSFGNASPVEPESPAARFGGFEMENQSVASLESNSSISSAGSNDYPLGLATFVADSVQVTHPGTPQYVQSAKHETSFNDFFGLTDNILLPFHQDLHKSLENQGGRHGY